MERQMENATTTETNQVTAPIAEAPPAAPQVAEPPQQSGKVLTMPQSAIGKIKAEGREQGKKLAYKELDAKAQAMGFANHEDLLRAASAHKQRSAEKPAKARPDQTRETTAQPTKPNPGKQTQMQTKQGSDSQNREYIKLQREHAKLLDKVRESNQARAREEKRRKLAERRVDEVEARSELIQAAMGAGVKDPDLAIELLRRETAAMTPEQLATFDEKKYFAEMRDKRPMLFGVETIPASTQPVETANVPAPAQPPSPAQSAPQKTEAVDGRALTPQQYDAVLKKHGISPRSTWT